MAIQHVDSAEPRKTPGRAVDSPVQYRVNDLHGNARTTPLPSHGLSKCGGCGEYWLPAGVTCDCGGAR